MEQKSLSKWLKVILIGVGLCGLVVYFFIFPSYGDSLVYSYPEFGDRYWPWLIFLWVSGIPCYAVLVLGWKIASNIGKDKSFSDDNAKYLKWISWLAACDGIFFFVGNVVLLLANMSHPGVALFSLLVVFAGVAVAVAAAALSHLVQKAAALQEQSDLTI
ncbi:DUF2975 domain-containing protein [Oribacterium sp. oral taxon 078]|uniref:DUF2975 domain-containing protein n=1 Tax=Oribacterium sp. oral taxon 078 TaxID=652706 RepID=UPI00055EF43B|nr:DUF2975 domain-containing protein [Oribacterium sp. oral taxon 078]